MTRRLRAARLARPGARRGAAYTLIVLMTTLALLSAGSAFVTPTRHALEVARRRQASLQARELARGGLRWAAKALNASGAASSKLEAKLSTGTLNVLLKAHGTGFLVESSGRVNPKLGDSVVVVASADFARVGDRLVLVAVRLTKRSIAKN